MTDSASQNRGGDNKGARGRTPNPTKTRRRGFGGVNQGEKVMTKFISAAIVILFGSAVADAAPKLGVTWRAAARPNPVIGPGGAVQNGH